KLSGPGDASLGLRDGEPAPSLPPPGYEIDLSARKDKPIGALWKGGKKVRDAADAGVAPGQWFTLEVIAVGPRIRVLVNGKEVVDYTDPSGARAKARVALQQDHTAIAGDDLVG